jgi:hypothetical protein
MGTLFTVQFIQGSIISLFRLDMFHCLLNHFWLHTDILILIRLSKNHLYVNQNVF